MIEGRSVLAIVPARAGSKGIARKNLRAIGGRPLVARVGDVVRSVSEIDRAIVSTDDIEIAKMAATVGLEAPFVRPATLSSDAATSLDVIVHALEFVEALDGHDYGIVVLLEPTSPLRTAEHVSAAIRMLIERDFDSVWTLSLTDSKAHPLKQLIVTDGVLEFYDPKGRMITARQQLKPVYHRNGVAYVFTRDCLLGQRSIIGRKAGALVIDDEQISIDTERDIDCAEWIMSRRSGKAPA